MKKEKYYSLKNILAKGCIYNLIIGERSNGKSYSVLELIIKNWVDKRKKGAILRRFMEDFRSGRADAMFNGHVANGLVDKLTHGEWSTIVYYSRKWYLARVEDDKIIRQEEPFCYAFSIASMEHDKSTSYPDVTTILFDEFITRGSYLNDEFVMFQNVLSTIIRDRNDVIIFMLGNTVNKYCPYYNEMGLSHVKDQEQGTIDVYHYGDSSLTVAVEYCKPNKDGKASDMYFAFDSPRLQMITQGGWELDIYPHCPVKYRPKDIRFIYFIEFDGELLQAEVVSTDSDYFTFIHRKSTPIKSNKKDIIFKVGSHSSPNVFNGWKYSGNKMLAKIGKFYSENRVFYQDNEIGEIVRNFMITM